MLLKEHSRSFKNRDHMNLIIHINKNGKRTSTAHATPETYTCEVPRDVSRKLAADFVYNNGIVEVSLLHV